MTGHRVAQLLVAGSLVALLAGCTSSGSSTGASPAATPTSSAATSSSSSAPPASTTPVGIVAIGHSGLTGENSNPDAPNQDAKQNSWATGTTPAVDSIYQRLVAANPATEGHVANEAVGGTDVTALKGQAATALSTVPTPQLVIMQTTDNDIKCDGTDAANIAPFGATLKDALQSITDASPKSTILIVGQLGRPRVAYIKQLVAKDPSAKDDMTGSGVCDFYDGNGKLSLKGFATLTTIVNAYEAELARVCATFPNCHTAEGVRATYVDKLDTFSSDWNHLNVHGLAGEAALEWPVVAKLLGLS